MSVSSQQRGTWAKKLDRLTKAATRAEEDVLVAVCQATEIGLSLADIAYMIGDKSSSTIRPKADKGKKILEGRKRA